MKRFARSNLPARYRDKDEDRWKRYVFKKNRYIEKGKSIHIFENRMASKDTPRELLGSHHGKLSEHSNGKNATKDQIRLQKTGDYGIEL